MDEVVVIAQSYRGVPVIAIESYSFDHAIYMKQIILPKTLKVLAPRAFDSCTALTDIVIPAGVEEVYESVFAGCTNLKAIYFEAEAPSEYWPENWMGDGCNAVVYWAGEWSYVDGVPTPN